jgi:hypothetical protein
MLWAENNPWLETWNQCHQLGTLAPLTVPIGDLQDIHYVSINDIRYRNIQRLRKIANRYGAQNILIVTAQSTNTLIPEHSVQATYISSDGQIRKLSLAKLDPSLKLPQFFQQAIANTVEAMERVAKKTALERQQKEQSLNLVAYLKNFEDWIKIREIIQDTPLIRSHEIISLSCDRARLRLTVLGPLHDLTQSLKTNGLKLSQDKKATLTVSFTQANPQGITLF